ncbi:MAG: hypothetical protein JXB25_03430, partial [Deltaproteobacteria bacterium]|nr:hypothetical protein [Deltaproteobacteria bacterium]
MTACHSRKFLSGIQWLVFLDEPSDGHPDSFELRWEVLWLSLDVFKDISIFCAEGARIATGSGLQNKT